jgi:hypothetical protein
MTRKAFYERPFDFADFMSAWYNGEKMNTIDEYTFDMRMSLDHYTPSYYPSTVDLYELIHEHLHTKYRVSNAFNRTFKDEIEEDVERAWSDAYWSQHESDLINFLQDAFKDLAGHLAEGGSWVWAKNGKPVDEVYEADGFLVRFKQVEFLDQFAGDKPDPYSLTKTLRVKIRECLGDPDEVFDDWADPNASSMQIDPEDFEGRYGHCPDVKDDDIRMFFDDYADETPLMNKYRTRNHVKQIKGWVKNRVPLIHRRPLQELDYAI